MQTVTGFLGTYVLNPIVGYFGNTQEPEIKNESEFLDTINSQTTFDAHRNTILNRIDLTKKSTRGQLTALHLAAAFGTTDDLDKLIKKGADLKVLDKDGNTPLHYACDHQKKNILFLLDAGADLNALNGYGRTPLFGVAKYFPEYIEEFARRGADVNIQANNGESPIHMVASYHPNYLQTLINLGADVNAKGFMDSTPLHTVASYYPQYAHLLVKQGGDFTFLGKHGYTPADSLALRKSDHIYGILLDSRNAEGQTPLHSFAERDKDDYLKMFIERGACIWLKNNKGETAMDIAKEKGNTKALAVLEEEASKPMWRLITTHERDDKGNFIEEEGQPKEWIYLRDGATNDLYVNETDTRLMLKSVYAYVATPFFMVGTMVANLAKILSDIAMIAFSFYKTFKNEGLLAMLKKMPISIAWEMPKAVANRIWRALCAPFYAIKMMGLCFYTCYNRNEGRKAMNQVQEAWDEKGLLWLTGLEKVGNLSTSKVSSFARFQLKAFN